MFRVHVSNIFLCFCRKRLNPWIGNIHCLFGFAIGSRNTARSGFERNFHSLPCCKTQDQCRTIDGKIIKIKLSVKQHLINSFFRQSPAGTEYLIITPDRCLIFPSVDYVRNLVTKHSIRQSLPVVIDCSHVYGADYTAATVIESITQDFAKRDQPLFFYNLKPSVCAVFEGLSPVDFIVYYREEDLDELMREKAYKPKQVLSA